MSLFFRGLMMMALAIGLVACNDQQGSQGPVPAVNHSGLPDFISLVEQNAPVVVNISTEIDPRQADGQMEQRVPEMFRHFFEGMDDLFRAPQPEGESMGSGFIISDDGYILSNYHVVAGADRIIVRLQDRRELEAELVGHDERSDIVLLKVEADNLPVASIGSSEALRVGEWVLAIGAPFGFDSSVTAGIVSAKGRALPSENYVPFIQTDVAINPGNSGGPLFNLAGDVVGINSQIISRNGGYMGLSFAIPIDMAMDVVRQLKETGKVSRGWLGVMIQPVDRELANSFGLDKPTGALVAEVLKDSPAAEAGLKPGDVIIAFDGEEIEESSELPQVVGLMAPGDEAEAELMRDGEPMAVTVTVGELPDDAESQFQNSRINQAEPLGLTVEPVSEAAREELKLDAGVRVTRVDEGPAARAGVQQGDILVSLNGRPLTSPEAFAEAVGELPETGSVPLLINRKGASRFLALPVE